VSSGNAANGVILNSQLACLLEMHFDSHVKLELARRVRVSGAITRDNLVHELERDEALAALAVLTRSGFLDAVDDVVVLGPRATFDFRFLRLVDLYEREPGTVMSVLSDLIVHRLRDDSARMRAESQRRARCN
jgi:hypothetical protein